MTRESKDMVTANRKLCPFCAWEIQSNAILCDRCGLDLHTMKIDKSPAKGEPEDHYRIVADGYKFGIAYQGEIKVHGLGLKEAENILAILNSIISETEGVFAG